ncbi:ABC transporter ATP-binding protein [Rhodoligotrophos ferricapiens]|uniref:ABC transporter ATP-binding protein n=1 Tax=Rhodoligotrophos ferricapiens TaxID=3069264 RepID=UPI00315CED57
MDAVRLVNISKSFGPVRAVTDCSFSVARGQIVSLLGPSGCGKTTILRMIAGFETPSSGQILISGRDVSGTRPYERNVGIVFQEYALFPHMTVEQNIAYGLKRRGYPARELADRVASLLKIIQLSGYEKRRPNQLSGGQQQRVALARAIAVNPDVVLLDEPLSALDAKLRQELRVELKEVLGKVGAAVIVVTHDQEEAMSLGSTVIVMNRGRVEQVASPADIYARPANRFVAEFVGRSNWFEGKISGGDGNGARFDTKEGLVLTLAPSDIPQGSTHDVCVRPERIRAIYDGKLSPGENQIEAIVIEATYLGPDLAILAETRGGKRIAVVEKNLGQPVPQHGAPVVLAFDSADCIVVAGESKARTVGN